LALPLNNSLAASRSDPNWFIRIGWMADDE
jgi:hypothetical protein